MYIYNAYVTKVYDADTITVDIDLGFGVNFKKQSLRLARINAPEVRGSEKIAGKISRDWLRERIFNKNIVVKTTKDMKGKYGRYVADIFIDNININDELVENKLAKFRRY